MIKNNSSKKEIVKDTEKFSTELKISAIGWTWNTTEVVSTESTRASRRSGIAVDNAGNAHVTWVDSTNYGSSGTDPDIFYKRWNATSNIWTTTEVVSTESPGSSNYPTIAVDAIGNAHVAWYDFSNYSGSGTDPDIFYKRWNASSSAWTTTEVVSTESTGSSAFPTIAVDGAGNAHVTWRDVTNYNGSGTDEDIFYKRWDASSGMWATTEVVSTGSISPCIYPAIVVDGAGNVHVTWQEYSGTDEDIYYKRRNASNSMWGATEVVSTESTTTSYTPAIAVDVVGTVHIAWYDYTNYSGSGTDSDLFYKRWNATSSAWTITEVVSTESTADSASPTIAVDGADNLHLAWQDYTNYGGSGTDSDIFYKLWNFTSSTWTMTEVVSTESTNVSFSPAIVVDGVGNAHVTWEDQTNYSGVGIDYDIFYKRLSFTPEVIINSPHQNELIGDVAPNFNISVTLSQLDTMWYTLDEGITNTTINQLTGTIDQTEWDKKGPGTVSIRFYASYYTGFEGYAEVTVIKKINIFSPENKSYTVPMSGHYPATYGFESDIVGSDPKGWEEVSTSGDFYVTTISNKFGHNKVLEGYDSGNGAFRINHYFNTTEGTIEFWMAHTSTEVDHSMSTIIFSSSGDVLFGVVLSESNIEIFTSTGKKFLSTYNVSTWYHFRFDFRSNLGNSYEGLNPNEFKLFFNGVYNGTYGFENNGDPGYLWCRSTYNNLGSYYSYWDAFGFSWDLKYDVGDNLNEGLLLSFENTTVLDWVGYSLDGQANKTISGNTTIPMPENGFHSIQIFGNDSLGIIIPSDMRFFSVDIPPQITVELPHQNNFFGTLAPNFEITIVGSNLNTTWYTLDDGIINKTFTALTGPIDQTEWDKKGDGSVIIRFYANDSFGREGYAEVVVNKDLNPPISSLSFIPYRGTNEVNVSTTFILTADDGLGSGVSVIRYRINNSAWIDYTGIFDLSSYEYGDYLISYQAIDVVNNIETENTLLVKLVELPGEPTEPDIPGFNILLLIGIICVITVFLIRKRRKLIN